MSDPACLRILDANFNRAREALRVMEEYARFALDDAGLAAPIKELRHALADAQRRFYSPTDDRGSGVECRDVGGDVGREIAVDTEYRRGDASEVAVAAAKRLSEALRVLEEFGKTINIDFARAVERLRYQGYDLERRLVLTTQARQRFARVRLYVLLTESLCRGDWFETARAAIDGGADCIQLREKDLSDRGLLERAKKLARLCRDHAVLSVVNDRPDIALAASADGVHLGQDDLPVAAARRILPPTMLVGVSTHTIDQVRAAAAVAPDYIAVGPMFDSPTKPQAHIAGPALLAAARKVTSIPVVAIGGITESNAGDVLRQTPCGLCVCQAVIAHADVPSATRRLRKIVDSAMGFADPRNTAPSQPT